jgi:hypothetical protein
MTRPAGTLGIATGEVADAGVVTGVTVGVMVLFVPEGDPLELLLLLVPGATLLFTASARAIGDDVNGSAVEAAMKSARATRVARRSSRLSCLMTDALLLADIGVGTDLPRIKSFTNSPLVFECFWYETQVQKGFPPCVTPKMLGRIFPRFQRPNLRKSFTGKGLRGLRCG